MGVAGLFLSVFMGVSIQAHAQEVRSPGRPLAAVIDEYVREGLASNLSLQAQTLEVERATAALDEARARYFPDIGLAARYSKSDGGRTIEIPLGTMLNPVYQTLNEMLMAQGQPPRFPAMQNESIAFLRETEQDTRLTMRMPIIAPADTRRGARAARIAGGQRIFAHGTGAAPQARHHRRLPALAGIGA